MFIKKQYYIFIQIKRSKTNLTTDIIREEKDINQNCYSYIVKIKIDEVYFIINSLFILKINIQINLNYLV